MPPKKHRINKARFLILFATGKRIHTQYATFIYKTDDTKRIRVVVSKKIENKASQRNLIYRKLTHTCFKALQESNFTGNIICIPKKNIKDKPYSLYADHIQETILNLS